MYWFSSHKLIFSKSPRAPRVKFFFKFSNVSSRNIKSSLNDRRSYVLSVMAFKIFLMRFVRSNKPNDSDFQDTAPRPELAVIRQ